MDYFQHVPIHDNSRQAYNARIAKWLEYMPTHFKSITNIVMLPDLALKVLNERLPTNTPSSRHCYIVAVQSFIRHHLVHLIECLSKEVVLPLRERWNSINQENAAPIVQRRMENKPTVLQEAKGGSRMTREEITAIREGLPMDSIERLLISMYTLIPPVRADYFATEVLKGDEAQPTARNYVRIRGDGTMTSVLTDFKTAKIYRQITNELPPELVRVVVASLTKAPRSYLFVNANGKPHTRNSFTLWSRRVLSRVFGKDFTLVFFRHAYATHHVLHMGQITDAQIKDISDKMGHSAEMFKAYRWIQGEDGADVDGSESEEKE
jgi:integrase